MSESPPDSQSTDDATEDDVPFTGFAARRLDASRRRHRVSQVRQAIESNEYENDLKISIAADRIIDALFKE